MAAALLAAEGLVSVEAVRAWGLTLDEYASTAIGRAGNPTTPVAALRPRATD